MSVRSITVVRLRSFRTVLMLGGVKVLNQGEVIDMVKEFGPVILYVADDEPDRGTGYTALVMRSLQDGKSIHGN